MGPTPRASQSDGGLLLGAGTQCLRRRTGRRGGGWWLMEAPGEPQQLEQATRMAGAGGAGPGRREGRATFRGGHRARQAPHTHRYNRWLPRTCSGHVPRVHVPAAVRRSGGWVPRPPPPAGRSFWVSARAPRPGPGTSGFLRARGEKGRCRHLNSGPRVGVRRSDEPIFFSPSKSGCYRVGVDREYGPRSAWRTDLGVQPRGHASTSG